MTITEDILIQCVSIRIKRDQSRQRRYECFTFRISATATIDGLSIEPSEAQICIVGTNCECYILLHATHSTPTHDNVHLIPTTAIPITIGIRQSLYYVDESAGSVLVCSRVLSGRTATRSIYMEIYTVQGEAKGNPL